MKYAKKTSKLPDLLRNLPERELPRDLTPLVLAKLAPKRLSAWRRLWRLIKTPKTITITPLKLASGMAACVLFLLMILHVPHERFQTAVRQADPQLVSLTFSMENSQAHEVFLIGSFNGWKPEGYAMKPDRLAGRWMLEIKVPPGRHEYAFLIDGQKAVPDPNAAFYKMDGFGSRNSIVFATSSDENFL